MIERSIGRSRPVAVGVVASAIVASAVGLELVFSAGRGGNVLAVPEPLPVEAQPVDLNCAEVSDKPFRVTLSPNNPDYWLGAATSSGVRLEVRLKVTGTEEIDGSSVVSKVSLLMPNAMVDTISQSEFTNSDSHHLPGGIYAIPGREAETNTAFVDFSCTNPQLYARESFSN